jgi:type IV secretion system T-DNA border endonuclease VirD2
MVVKAEGEQGQRLHIHKAMLREWREDFAQLMRDQGVAANATPRQIRGRNRRKDSDAIYRAQRRGASHTLREQVTAVARELARTGTITDPAHAGLLKTRMAVLSQWLKAAEVLDMQGEVVLARNVRQFARRLPPVLTDKERLAMHFVRHIKNRTLPQRSGNVPIRDRGQNRTL